MALFLTSFLTFHVSEANAIVFEKSRPYFSKISLMEWKMSAAVTQVILTALRCLVTTDEFSHSHDLISIINSFTVSSFS